MFGYGGTQQQQQASAAAAAAALSSFGYPTGGQSNIQPASLGGLSSVVGSAYAQFGRAAIDAASAAAGYGVQPFVPSSDAKRPSVPAGSANLTPIGSGGGVGSSSISAHYAGYEQAVYAAANSYVQAKSAGRTSQWMKMKKRPGLGHPTSAGGQNPGGLATFYCEVCRISCAGNQTFKEHLEGKIHKRKQALASNTRTLQNTPSMTSFKCEACNVSCASKDTYDAHVKGSKHFRTINLLRKMNKEIPSSAEPTIIPGTTAGGAVPPPIKKVVGVAGTRFVGGSTLTSTGEQVLGTSGSGGGGNGAMNIVVESNIKPVGEEFIDEQRDIYGKVKNFTCKLCQCSFTDPAAKNMHLKGRRHRLNYKAKVNPDLEVEPKANEKHYNKGGGGRSSSGGGPRRTEYPDIVPNFPLMRRGTGAPPAHMPFCFPPAAAQRRMDESEDDRYVVAKDLLVQPSKEDGQAVEKLVNLAEKTLKAVSDKLAEEEKNTGADRCMKGVMRVGLLAKNLLLKGDTEVNLVVLCSTLPTRCLLNKIHQYFSECAEKGPSDVLEVKEDQANSSLVITLSGVWLVCRVTLTCVLLRDPSHSSASAAGGEGGSETKSKVDEGDLLPSGPCLKALAELRHTKYYQSNTITLRIIRDIANRVPTWRPMTVWAMELLVERAISSAPVPLSPSEAVRRVFEVLAGGVIIGKNFSLTDPCEKEAVDALGNLNAQEREDITSSAQHALRLICFNQIHKILGIDRISDAVAAEEDGEGSGSDTGNSTIEKGQQASHSSEDSNDRKRARESLEGGTSNSDEQQETDAKKPKSDPATAESGDSATMKTDG